MIIYGEAIVPPPIKTWTWNLKETVTIVTLNVIIKFKSNNVFYSKISTERDIDSYLRYDSTVAASANSHQAEFHFTNEAYRTIKFYEEPTGELLTWLQANGTRT